MFVTAVNLIAICLNYFIMFTELFESMERRHECERADLAKYKQLIQNLASSARSGQKLTRFARKGIRVGDTGTPIPGILETPHRLREFRQKIRCFTDFFFIEVSEKSVTSQ
jgi:hypothetical protein